MLLVATILCTGVIVQAHWQYRGQQGGDNLEVRHTPGPASRGHVSPPVREPNARLRLCPSQLLPEQDVLKRLAALKTRKYRPPRARRDSGPGTETEDCAVCLEQFYHNQVCGLPQRPPRFRDHLTSLKDRWRHLVRHLRVDAPCGQLTKSKLREA